MLADPEKQKLAAALEQLEIEKQRRLDERVERGEVVRVMLDPVVVGHPDTAAAAIEQAKADKLAALRAAGEKREVIFAPTLMEGETEPITAIVTGVPRAGRGSEGATRIGNYKHIKSKGWHK
jgi:hypothetical protein